MACLSVDDSEDDNGSIDEFIEQASAARPSYLNSSSSWRPSFLKGGINAVRGSMKEMSSGFHPGLASKIYAPKAVFRTKGGWDAPSKALFPLSSLDGASISEMHPPPATALMSAYSDLPCMESLPSEYSFDSQMDMTPVRASKKSASHPHREYGLHMWGSPVSWSQRRSTPPSPPLFSYEPPCSYHQFHELLEVRDTGLNSLTEMSATEFAAELHASAPPVCADPPRPRHLASQQFISMTPSPAPPHAFSRKTGASFSRRARAPAPIVFNQPEKLAPPSPPQSGGFGGFFQRNISAPGAKRKGQQKQFLKGRKQISKPDTVAWNELFELQHEVFTHDLTH